MTDPNDPFAVPGQPSGDARTPSQGGYGTPPPPPPGYGPPPAQGYGAPPPPPGYGQPSWGDPAAPYAQWGAPAGPPRGTNGMAIASLVLGIVWIYWLGSILALVFGYQAKKQIRQTGEGGSGLATAGIVLGYIGLAFLALFIIVIVGVGAAGFESTY